MCPLETTSGPSMVSDLKMVNKGRNAGGAKFLFRCLDIFVGHMMEGSSVVPIHSLPTHMSYNTMVTN